MPCELSDGGWRYTGHDAIPDIGRKVRLPLWKFVNRGNICPESVLDTHPPDAHGNRYTGRVVVDWWPDNEPVTIDHLDMFGPRDVVAWPLYYGAPHANIRGPGTGVRLRSYDVNLALLADLCQRYPGIGIMLGNCGSELAYHHLLCAPDQRHREWVIEQDVRFVRETGKLVRDLGGRPWWGPMEREVLIDCYHGGWRMRAAAQEFDGAFVVFQEGGMFPRWTMVYGNSEADGIWLDGEEVPHPSRPEWRDDYGLFVAWSHREPYPYPRLLQYFTDFEVWHCIGYDREFLLGYDNTLAYHRCRGMVY
jgi:hypothetical protein